MGATSSTPCSNCFSGIRRGSEGKTSSKSTPRPHEWSTRTTPQSSTYAAPHVVLSTKSEEPWCAISMDIQEILEEQGCTVYNPNTDSAEQCEQAGDGWLLTFNEHLNKVKETQGFVLQIEPGTCRQKSDRQLAEEKQAGWLEVPRIGYWAHPNTKHRGGSTYAEVFLRQAVKAAKRQWLRSIQEEVEMVSPTYEPLDAKDLEQFHAAGHVNGRARCTLPSGALYEGDFSQGKFHGKGAFTWPDGQAYRGDWVEDQAHGRGTLTFPNGALEVGRWERNQLRGESVQVSLDRTEAFLFRDGQKVGQISVEEAQQKVQELDLPSLCGA